VSGCSGSAWKSYARNAKTCASPARGVARSASAREGIEGGRWKACRLALAAFATAPGACLPIAISPGFTPLFFDYTFFHTPLLFSTAVMPPSHDTVLPFSRIMEAS